MTQKFRNLGVIFQEDKLSAVAERRRMPRLSLATELFRLNQGRKVFSVVDLSLGGMALRILDPSDWIWFSVGAQVQGILNLRREKIPLQARVRHVGSDLAGCEWVNASAHLTQSLEKVFDPVFLGRKLKPIPAAENGTLWYHGPSGTDLILWRGLDGQFRRFALFLLGNYSQWDEKNGISTGRAKSSFEKSEVWGAFRFETLLLEEDESPDPRKLEFAKTVVLNSNLPQQMKTWCLCQLDEYPVDA